jgi:phosphoserine aminotransferase
MILALAKKIDMKKIAILLLTLFSILSCKNETKSEVNLEENRSKSYDQNDGLITMKGDFVYDSQQNAAVFETPNGTIYGVVVDDNMHKLNEKAKPFKADKYSSVQVTVRVKRIKNTNPKILWENNLEIKDILKVEKPDSKKEDVIKLAN